MNELLPGLQAVLARLEPALIELRRDIHAHPELAHREHRTTALVTERLAAVGYHIHPLPDTGLVADLGPHEPTYRIALRADLDALPVADQTGLPWASRVDGVCHACGHDLHVAAVLGAGLAFAEFADELRRRDMAIRLVFQPAEEMIPGGAIDVVELGWMDYVDRIYAVHCDPTLDIGEVGLVVGPLTAAADAIEVTLKGHGGHTSRPHLTQDLTYALAKVITDVPAALSRRLDPRAGAVLVWGHVESGIAPNVIPSSGTVSGTLRMLDAEAWAGVGPLVEELVAAVVSPYGVQIETRYVPGVPPVVNERASVDALREGVAFAGSEAVPTTQSLGGEDFAWYLTLVPGAMARLGTRPVGGPTYDLHQGDLVVDESAVVLGAKVLVGAAIASIPQLDAERAASPADSGDSGSGDSGSGDSGSGDSNR